MNYVLPTLKKGDTFQGEPFHMTEKINGVTGPMDLTGVKIRIDFRTQPKAIKVLRLSSYAIDDPIFPGGGITITNPANGDWMIDKQVIDIPPATYVYDVEFSFPVEEGAEPDIQTLFDGSWTIEQDITYD